MIVTDGTLSRLLAQLSGVREVGPQKWQACCPAHEDGKASLSITEASDSTILVHCHANCKTDDVLAAVGLRLSDLFPNSNGQARQRIVKTYDYRDPDGSLVFQVVRFEPKDFRQRKPVEGGGWSWSVKGCNVIPYRLPELAAADKSQPVFIVEGEKDVGRIISMGLVATTNAGGSEKWRPDHSKYLAGYRVVIIGDNDAPGRAHASKVAESLEGIAQSIKVLELPGLPPKGDVSDWFDAGGTADELVSLAATTTEWMPTTTSKSGDLGHEAPIRHTTDFGNAERFAEQHGADVRYCHAWRKWLVWNTRYWPIDTDGAVMRRAKQTARSIYVEASGVANKEHRESLARWAAASERRERLNAMIALTESELPIPVAVDSLDADPWLLNCRSGTIDLRTGELREHRRDDLLTKCCPIEYPSETGVDPELWLTVLDRIFAGNARLISFLQRLFGVSLVGEVHEHILPIFWGGGCNGKTVILETWAGMLGADYAMKAPPAMLMVSRSDRHPTELADLHGKRLVAAVETADGGRMSEALVKELTGGDSIRARRMRQDFWQFRPSHTVVIATNHKPTVRGVDHGIWRRLRLVPFTVTIPPAEQDTELTHKLRDEWPAILRWAVSGCLEWQRGGLNDPDEVLAATDNYRCESDTFAQWLEECCEVDPAAEWKASLAYRSYREHCDGRNERPMSANRFSEQVSVHGFTRSPRRRDGYYYMGFRNLAFVCEHP